MIRVDSRIEGEKRELGKGDRKKWISLWFQLGLLAWLLCNTVIIVANFATQK